MTPRFKIMMCALVFSTLCFLIRFVDRTPELAAVSFNL